MVLSTVMHNCPRFRAQETAEYLVLKGVCAPTLLHGLQLAKVQRTRECRILNPKGSIYTNLPSTVQGTLRKRGANRVGKPGVMGDYRETVF